MLTFRVASALLMKLLAYNSSGDPVPIALNYSPLVTTLLLLEFVVLRGLRQEIGV